MEHVKKLVRSHDLKIDAGQLFSKARSSWSSNRVARGVITGEYNYGAILYTTKDTWLRILDTTHTLPSPQLPTKMTSKYPV